MKLFCFFILLIPIASQALDNSIFSNQAQSVIRQQSLHPSYFGVVISKKSKPSKILYSLNGDKLFKPASLTKIITLSALQNEFLPFHTFKTRLVSSASRVGSELKGPLVLKGGGDPTFTSETLWNLVNVFFYSGIKTIAGDIVIDDSLFKKPFFMSRSDRSYEALTSAASFNWNSVTFRIRPTKVGEKAFVTADPLTSYVKIINKVTTSRAGTKRKVSIKRKFSLSDKEVFELRGHIAVNEKEWLRYRNIKKPYLWIGHNLKSFLAQRGIKVLGEVRKGKCSNSKKSCKVLAEWEGEHFFLQAYKLMKHSSNFISRMLTIQLSLLKGSRIGDIKKGMFYIDNYIRRSGIENYAFYDPSGLSSKNRFRPLDIHKILAKDLKSRYHNEIFASYPLDRGVGTLKYKLLHKTGEYPIRAKTGTLSGVLGLSGFAYSDTEYLFTFLYNGPRAKINQAQIVFDEFIKYLFKSRKK